jgi:opacity protein-like surface antigen
MKTNQLILITAAAFSTSAFGGVSEPVSAPAPVQPAPTTQWFVGGSFGQINSADTSLESDLEDAFGIPDIEDVDIPGLNGGMGDLDFDMYTLHFGRYLGADYYGFKPSVYLEVGYLAGDADGEWNLDLDQPIDGGEWTVGDALEDEYYYQTGNDIYEDFPGLDDGHLDVNLDLDIDIIPVTINFMVERSIAGGFGFYLSAGAGYAFTDCTLDIDSDIGDESYSDTDGGFYAQASAGLNYYFNENVGVYAGARYLYLDSLDLGETEIELDDDFAWEVGLRYAF